MTREERLRELAEQCQATFDLSRPYFPASDGMFPSDPKKRQAYIDAQVKSQADFIQKARDEGFSEHEFMEALISYRKMSFAPK